MTLPLPRSRPTTARGPSTPTRKTSSRLAGALAAAAVALSLTAGTAGAQSWQRPTVVPVTGQPAPISFEPIPPLPSMPQPQLPDNKPRTLPAPGDVRPVFMQQPQPLGADLGGQADQEFYGYQIQLEPPGPQRLFRLES